MLADLIFFAFAAILLLAGVGLITAKNPVHSVLFMILAFFNAAGIFVLLGAEFLGLLLIMVYVGAIAVMFLFVVMTIDIDFAALKEGFAHYLPLAVVVGGIMLFQLVGAALGIALYDEPIQLVQAVPQEENLRALGFVLFTDYAVPFIGAAMVLLVAMVGAIVLAHRKRGGVKRQNIRKQLARTREDSLMMTSPKSGEGVHASLFVGKSVE